MPRREAIEVRASGLIDPEARRFTEWQLGRFMTVTAFEGVAQPVDDPWEYFYELGYVEKPRPTAGEPKRYLVGWENTRRFFREQGGMDYQKALVGWRQLQNHVANGHHSRLATRHICDCPIEVFHIADWGLGYTPDSLAALKGFLDESDVRPGRPSGRYPRSFAKPTIDLVDIFGGALKSQLPKAS